MCMLSDDVVCPTTMLYKALEVFGFLPSHRLGECRSEYKGCGLPRDARKGYSLTQEVPEIDVEHVASI